MDLTKLFPRVPKFSVGDVVRVVGVFSYRTGTIIGINFDSVKDDVLYVIKILNGDGTYLELDSVSENELIKVGVTTLYCVSGFTGEVEFLRTRTIDLSKEVDKLREKLMFAENAANQERRAHDRCRDRLAKANEDNKEFVQALFAANEGILHVADVIKKLQIKGGESN